MTRDVNELSAKLADKTYDDYYKRKATNSGTVVSITVGDTGDIVDVTTEKRPLDNAQDTTSPAYSEMAIADEFVEQNADNLRYIANSNTWLLNRGTHWEEDEKLEVFTLCREICRDVALGCNDLSRRKNIASKSTAWAVQSLAKTYSQFATKPEDWDANEWLLNTPGGVYDLRTGECHDHNPSDLLRTITAVAPGGECPLFHKFLDEITDGNTELQSFMQRILGYCLTGSTREHAMFFFYGVGGNGKTVLTRTVANILSGYHKAAAVETFTVSKTTRHSEEIAWLKGARLILATETESGQSWAESRIKALTGGESISARRMYGHRFTYDPQFKLIISGNHKPKLKKVDEAIRRRIHLVPFNVTIPPDKRDTELPEKLKQEWPGILKWMIQGCLEWQMLGGLEPPEIVSAATNEYLDSQDRIAAWADDNCLRNVDAFEKTTDLFNNWKQWGLSNNEEIGTRADFKDQLNRLGFQGEIRKSSGRGYAGYELKRADMSGEYFNK